MLVGQARPTGLEDDLADTRLFVQRDELGEHLLRRAEQQGALVHEVEGQLFRGAPLLGLQHLVRIEKDARAAPVGEIERVHDGLPGDAPRLGLAVGNESVAHQRGTRAPEVIMRPAAAS